MFINLNFCSIHFKIKKQDRVTEKKSVGKRKRAWGKEKEIEGER